MLVWISTLSSCYHDSTKKPVRVLRLSCPDTGRAAVWDNENVFELLQRFNDTDSLDFDGMIRPEPHFLAPWHVDAAVSFLEGSLSRTLALVDTSRAAAEVWFAACAGATASTRCPLEFTATH